jgi:UDP-2,3-diacylglucosamine hydrolase
MSIIRLPKIEISFNKCVYFASDFHLGISAKSTSLEREVLICRWLQQIAPTAEHIFLLGDIFDAWLEYKTVVPKGFVRLLAALAGLRDRGIPITVFSGNHDLWMYGYFEEELDIQVLHAPARLTIGNHEFLLAHGDGLGPGDIQYKILKNVLRHPATQWVYRWLHPDLGLPLAKYFSGRGAHKKSNEDVFLGADKEFLFQFCTEFLATEHVDHFIFGHRHYMLQHLVASNSTYTNLGDWLKYNSYAVYDGSYLQLKTYG